MTILDVSLRKKLGDHRIQADFQCRSQGVIALFGPSGAGKTSIINMVAGLIRPDDGRIAVDGRVLFDSENRVDLPPEKRRIGYVFQDSRLFPHMSVRKNLTYGQRLRPLKERYIDFDGVVSALGVGHLLDRRPAKLSGGEKQRIAIGRALLTSPKLLLMDEPVSSVDQERKWEILTLIARLPEKFHVPILYVSHAAEEIRFLADDIIRVEGGEAWKVGDREGFFDDLMDRLGKNGGGPTAPRHSSSSRCVV